MKFTLTDPCPLFERLAQGEFSFDDVDEVEGFVLAAVFAQGLARNAAGQLEAPLLSPATGARFFELQQASVPPEVVRAEIAKRGVDVEKTGSEFGTTLFKFECVPRNKPTEPGLQLLENYALGG